MLKGSVSDLYICIDHAAVAWEERCGTREHPETKTITYKDVSVLSARGFLCKVILSDGSIIQKKSMTKSFTINGRPAETVMLEHIAAADEAVFDCIRQSNESDNRAPTSIRIELF